MFLVHFLKQQPPSWPPGMLLYFLLTTLMPTSHIFTWKQDFILLTLHKCIKNAWHIKNMLNEFTICPIFHTTLSVAYILQLGKIIPVLQSLVQMRLFLIIPSSVPPQTHWTSSTAFVNLFHITSICVHASSLYKAESSMGIKNDLLPVCFWD